MKSDEFQDLDEKEYIRHKLYSDNKSSFQRYAELVIGDASFWKLVKYELITMFLGPFPGALGLFLRKIFYPKLFKRVGKGTVFGRNVVVRNADRISLGCRVMIDDDCLIDARGSGAEGIIIGDEVVINRRVSIQSKIGPLTIGSNTDIGADSAIISQGGIYIGEMVKIAGGCMIGGGALRLDATAPEEVSAETEENDFLVRGEQRVTRGPIRIGSRCVLGGPAMVLDGTVVGAGSLITAGAVIREDVPADSVVVTHQRLMVVPRSQFGRTKSGAVGPQRRPPPRARTVDSEKVLAAIYRALGELNEQMPIEKHLEKSPDAPLMEPDGPLDSQGLVNLIVTTEQIIEEEFGRTIDLAEQLSKLENEAPLATVSSFAKHVDGMLAR